MSPANSVRYTQSCPTCGRRIQVRASLIGSSVACQHCNAKFIASSDDQRRVEEDRALMARVERVLHDSDSSVA